MAVEALLSADLVESVDLVVNCTIKTSNLFAIFENEFIERKDYLRVGLA